jgi:hypothetical protein
MAAIAGGHDGGYEFAVLGDTDNLAAGSLVCWCRDGRGVLNG